MSPPMNRREFLVLSGAGLAGMALWPSEVFAGGTGGMNVLWLGVDDLRCELGCYGRKHIRSPSIDELASQGVLFERAYVQQAVCAASRASFLTGCRPDTTGVDYPYTEWFRKQFLPKHPTVPSYFHGNGYYTQAYGKIHHGSPLDLLRLSEPYLGVGKNGYALPENQGKQGKARPPVECADVPDNAYKDGRLAERGIEALRRAAKQKKPWFLTLGFMKPHLPFAAPKKYWDLYKRDEIPLTPNPELPKGAPFYAPATFELPTYKWPWGLKTTEMPADKQRLLRHGYFACVSFIDAQIGKVLAELDRLGLRKNAIVMLWSDHGWHLGDQSCWGKHTNFERSTRSPLILSVPGMKNAGERTRALVEYVDMFPTLTELTGLKTPDYLEGTSMVPLMEDPDRPWKKAAFSQYPRWGKVEGYAIRTDRYRYVEWQKVSDAADGFWKGKKGDVHARELYDHKTDPNESVNVADRPEYLDTIKQLSAQLAAGWKAALPPGITNRSSNPRAPANGPGNAKRRKK